VDAKPLTNIELCQTTADESLSEPFIAAIVVSPRKSDLPVLTEY
jgi:hypothetical protein